MNKIFTREDNLRMRGASNLGLGSSFRIPWLFAILNEWNLYWLRFETHDFTEAPLDSSRTNS